MISRPAVVMCIPLSSAGASAGTECGVTYERRSLTPPGIGVGTEELEDGYA